MIFLLGVLAAVVGYLVGSISSARLVVGFASPKSTVEQVSLAFPGTDIVFESDSISASAVRLQLGARFGCLTAILDILKIALPTLAFRLWQPDEVYYLVAAGAGMVGHVWPIYYRFKGGRGESSIMGGLLVIDAVGLVVTTVLGWVLGWVAGNLLVLRWGFLALMIPWFWFRTHDIRFVIYMVFVNVVYVIAMIPELKQYLEFSGGGEAPSEEELSTFWGMGGQIGRVLDRYSIPALLKRLRQ